MQNAPVELRAKLAKAELLVVDEAKTCQQLWDAFLKFKAMEVKPKTMWIGDLWDVMEKHYFLQLDEDFAIC